MDKDMAKVLFSQEELQTRIRELGAQLSEDYRGKTPTMVCILKGAIMFYTDLVRSMDIPLTMDFMAVSSYGNSTKSSGEVEIRKDLSTSIEGKHVVIVEDIIDTGHTLFYLKRMLSQRHPASIKVCALLDKFERREADVVADYKAFDIANEFVVGYGLDYAQKYRNLPEIGVLKREIYEK